VLQIGVDVHAVDKINTGHRGSVVLQAISDIHYTEQINSVCKYGNVTDNG
jgi:hypothetical protein